MNTIHANQQTDTANLELAFFGPSSAAAANFPGVSVRGRRLPQLRLVAEPQRDHNLRMLGGAGRDWALEEAVLAMLWTAALAGILTAFWV